MQIQISLDTLLEYVDESILDNKNLFLNKIIDEQDILTNLDTNLK